MIEVDRLMIEEYHIKLIQMMENAGRCLAILAKQRFLSEPEKNKVVILAGTGGNGGGALVCGRRLASWGFEVYIFVTAQERMTDIPDHQLSILKAMEIPIHGASELHNTDRPDLIIDGIIGYSLGGAPRGSAKAMIQWANNADAPILSLDTPSGIELTNGTIFDPAIKADAALTLALPKVALYQKQVMPYRGELYLGDISVPPELYAHPSLNLKVAPIFKSGDILRID